MAKIQENLDYTFSWKDLIVVDKLMVKYVSDREKMHEELFNSTEEYTKDDIKEYVEYFMGANADDTDVDAKEQIHHKALWNIRHFLNRNYEFNLLPSYWEKVSNVNDCLFYYGAEIDDMNDEGIEEFISSEYDCIQNLKDFWNDYLQTIASYPMMHLEKLNKTVVMGCEVYFDKKTDDFVLNSFLEFLQNIKKDFPSLLKHFDRFLIVDNDYLRFLADDGGEDSGTQAFFTDDSIFLKCHCDDLKDESERFFYKEVLYHEFGHFIFSKLPEYLQLYWQQEYQEFKNKNLKMPRDEDRNSQLDVYMQECFADSFACWSFRDSEEIHDDNMYIHYPNEQIIDVFTFILKKAFF